MLAEAPRFLFTDFAFNWKTNLDLDTLTFAAAEQAF